MKNLHDYGIRLRNNSIGNHKTTCPQCSDTRKNKKDPCLSVTVKADGAVWNCHHCEWTGGFSNSERNDDWQPRKRDYKRPEYKPASPSEKLYDWFERRGIEADTVERFGISTIEIWMPGCEKGQKARAIAIPYYRDGELINVKYRTHDKKFRQEKDAEKIFFNLDATIEAETVIIAEGEMDAMIFEQCGFPAISVPDGAPAQEVAENSTKFEYVDNCIDWLEDKKIILAVDADGPGQILQKELARRIGKENCMIVKYPDGCKDANDVFLKFGADGIADLVARVDFYPVDGLLSVDQMRDGVLSLYRHGRSRGLSTGWPMMDEIMTVRPGDVWVVTGAPNNGKSEWLDALAVNMAKNHGWKCGLVSFENMPDEHIAKIAEKVNQKPFWDKYENRMNLEELDQAMNWAQDHFAFIKNSGDEPPTIDWILDRAKILVRRMGLNMLVIDPYNEIQKETSHQTETEFVSNLLGKVRRFAHRNEIMVAFVAHPQKLQRGSDGEYPVPSLYDISGGANWNNKADVGITIQRLPDYQAMAHVLKARRKEIGRQGEQAFKFNPVTGVYTNVDNLGYDMIKRF